MKSLRIFSLWVLLGCSTLCFCANKSIDKIQTNRIDSLTLCVRQLQDKIEGISRYNDHLCKLVDKEQEANANAIDNIANLIDAGNRVLNGWGIVLSCLALVIAIGGVVLGRYISIKWQQVSEIARNLQSTEKEFHDHYTQYAAMTEEVKEMINEAKKTNDDTRAISQAANELNQQIQDNIESLYLRLRDEETKTILQRLKDSPEDVDNAAATLYSRVLDKRFFIDLKLAYQNLLTRDEVAIRDHEDTYQSLFYLHFTKEAMRDPNLVEMFIKGLPESISRAFFTDVVKSTKDYMSAIEIYSNEEKITYISDYVLALQNASFSIPNSIFDDLFEKLPSDIIHKVWTNISHEDGIELFAVQISDYLTDMYDKKDNLTTSEKKFMEKYKAYIKQHTSAKS